MNDVVGVILSIVFVFVFIGIAQVLHGRGIITEEFTRKFVHIGVGHWIIVAYFIIEKMELAIIPPILFIFLNYMSYKKDLFSSIEIKKKENLGTIYYPISLTLLVLYFWSFNKAAAISGIMVMAWGDGLAAVVGQSIGKNKLFKEKTLEGSLAMLISTMISITLILYFFSMELQILPIAIISIAATVLELYSIKGLDNIFVPIITSFLFSTFFI